MAVGVILLRQFILLYFESCTALVILVKINLSANL